MASAPATIQLYYDWVGQGQIDSLPVHQEAIEKMSIGDLSRLHMATTATVGTISKTSLVTPKTGEFRVDISTTPITPRFYDGVNEGAPQGDFSPSKPPATDAGYRWWHPGLQMWTVLKTVDGITGFHPESESVQLMTARSVTAMQPGAPVVRDLTATSLREFTGTDTARDQSVIGVLIGEVDDLDFSETVDTGDVCYVAMNSAGKTVDIYLNGATRSVAKGDAIVTNDVVGEARTVGALASAVYTDQDSRRVGVPVGAFAEALEPSTSDGKARCRLLGRVGEGQWVFFSELSATSTAVSDTFHEDDLTGHLVDADHAPISMARMKGQAQITRAGGDIDVSFIFSVDGSTENVSFDFLQNTAAATPTDTLSLPCFDMPMVDDIASPAGPGELYSYNVSLSTGTLVTMNVQLLGYMH